MTRETVYYLERLQKTTAERNILTLDPGGGTLDDPFLIMEERIFYAEATVNDTHLGGENFDLGLERKNKKDLTSISHALRRLPTASLIMPRSGGGQL
ncbi:hypothetical protein BDM02DRAFT_3018501 [Thelephora ganbajun]|uniref:Uncharacterized protein n=1 Tax=Thelephora ganbajun TaxID=370292 RepID=A0ACB6ZBG8_THEGA|nr:hypothetical protein BDM02DRAFT_3018501 [Thelephora ganbajun]